MRSKDSQDIDSQIRASAGISTVITALRVTIHDFEQWLTVSIGAMSVLLHLITVNPGAMLRELQFSIVNILALTLGTSLALLQNQHLLSTLLGTLIARPPGSPPSASE